jgi:hypothetical protein
MTFAELTVAVNAPRVTLQLNSGNAVTIFYFNAVQ